MKTPAATTKKMERVLGLAALIAAHPPLKRGRNYRAYIDWELIDTMRAALEDIGIDWAQLKRELR